MNYEMAKKAAMRGETVRRCTWVHTARVYLRGTDWRFRDTGSICIMDGIDVNARDWVIVRKRPKSERDVFTHPRRGDVIEGAYGSLIDVLAVAPEAVLYMQRGVGIGSTSRNSFKQFSTSSWTVKTRAPKKGNYIHNSLNLVAPNEGVKYHRNP